MLAVVGSWLWFDNVGIVVGVAIGITETQILTGGLKGFTIHFIMMGIPTLVSILKRGIFLILVVKNIQ